MNLKTLQNVVNKIISQRSCNFFIIFNKSEWLLDKDFKWSEEEIDNANEIGLIGTKYGIDCYVTRPVEVTFSPSTK